MNGMANNILSEFIILIIYLSILTFMMHHCSDSSNSQLLSSMDSSISRIPLITVGNLAMIWLKYDPNSCFHQFNCWLANKYSMLISTSRLWTNAASMHACTAYPASFEPFMCVVPHIWNQTVHSPHFFVCFLPLRTWAYCWNISAHNFPCVWSCMQV